MERISVTSWYQGEEDHRVLPLNGEQCGTHSGSATEMEFWPLEHPTEPSDEDRPVKCPMSESSAVNVTEMSKERSTETPRKRMESTVMATSTSGEPITEADAGSTAARLYRKRHHTMTHGDIVIMPIMRTTTPLPPPHSAGKLAMLQMLHRKDSLDSRALSLVSGGTRLPCSKHGHEHAFLEDAKD